MRVLLLCLPSDNIAYKFFYVDPLEKAHGAPIDTDAGSNRTGALPLSRCKKKANPAARSVPHKHGFAFFLSRFRSMGDVALLSGGGHSRFWPSLMLREFPYNLRKLSDQKYTVNQP